MEELSPEDTRLLRQMQVQNQRLRQQLGLSDDAIVPEAEEAKRLHIGRLEQAIQRNFDLRAKLQNVDKEFALANVNMSNLSKEERLSLTTGQLAPPSSSTMSFAVEDQAEMKRQTDRVMIEINEVTRANIELIKVQDDKIKALEKEISVARRQHHQLTSQTNASAAISDTHGLQQQLHACESKIKGLMKNCQEIEEAMKQERQKQLGKETRNVQLLRTEREALLEEIEQLRQSMDKPPGEDMERSIVPGTAVLSAEADVLQAQLTEFNTRGQQEQVSLEQQVEELRRQKKEYKEQYDQCKAEKEKIQAEVEELRRTRDGAKDNERESTELRTLKEQLAGESGRCRITIRTLDAKISELTRESDDIRSRVMKLNRDS